MVAPNIIISRFMKIQKIMLDFLVILGYNVLNYKENEMSKTIRNAVEMSDVCEQIIRSLIISGESFADFMVGLNNALVHGEVFDAAGLDCDDETLQEIYEHVDAISKIAREKLS